MKHRRRDHEIGPVPRIYHGWPTGISCAPPANYDTSNPPFILNLTRPESISFCWAAKTGGNLLNCDEIFMGDSKPQTEFFSKTAKLTSLRGYPTMPIYRIPEMVADLVGSGGKFITALAHFESTDRAIGSYPFLKNVQEYFNKFFSKVKLN